MGHSSCQSSSNETFSYPLDPLNPDEIRAVVRIVKSDARFGEHALFETMMIVEPDPEILRALAPGESLPRLAHVNVFFNNKLGVTRVTVSLTAGKIVDVRAFPDAQPMLQLEQFDAFEDLVKADPGFIDACHKRGITDMSLVCVDPWSPGLFADFPGTEDRLLCNAFVWVRAFPDDNFYAHPVEGLNVLADLRTGEVLRIEDRNPVPIPSTCINYEAQFIKEPRQPFKPLNIVQPEGVSFSLKGHELEWDLWKVRIGFNAREALTLHDISYNGRPLINRASIVEMVVPYGSPDNSHFKKHVFDIGEYGVGKLANSLELGCDCLGVIEYLDGHMNTMSGEVMTIKNAICIHEEDNGLLWKHTDFRTNHCESRRGRKLVISCVATVANYDYSFNWYLFTDGNIEFEAKATGIINTNGCEPGQPGKYANEVSPGVAGQIHQHIFCARMDMALDGPGNSVTEVNTYAEPQGPTNPYGNAFYAEETVLKSELEACRKANQDTHRFWKVINPNKQNSVGKPTAYKILPTHPVTPMVHPDSPSGKRANYNQNHLWVTARDPEQRFPTGEFANRSDGTDGLSSFVLKNRPLVNTNLVVWHTFGINHIVRTEDFPVQPVVTCGFMMMPTGFFNVNPGIDLAPAKNTASCLAKAGCCESAQ